MSLARAHQKLAILSREFYLTDEQKTATLKVLKARAAKRQAQIKAAAPNESLPEVTPIRQDPEFRKILTEAQRKKIKKKMSKGGEEL